MFINDKYILMCENTSEFLLKMVLTHKKSNFNAKIPHNSIHFTLYILSCSNVYPPTGFLLLKYQTNSV